PGTPLAPAARPPGCPPRAGSPPSPCSLAAAPVRPEAFRPLPSADSLVLRRPLRFHLSLLGQRKVEDRAAVRRRLDPDAPAVPAHDLLADRQSDAGAGVLLPGVEPLEDHEDPLRVLRLDPDSVVTHAEEPLAVPLLGRDPDPGGIVP